MSSVEDEMEDTDNFQVYLLEQNGIMHFISRTVENTKKMGKEKLTLAVARNRLRILEENWQRCRQLHSQLQLHAPEEEHAYFKKAQFDSTEEPYLSACDFLATTIEQLAPTSATASTSSAGNERSQNTGTTPSTALPAIALPKYTGIPQEWEPFRDLFRSMVHRNASFDDVQRLHYLKTSLSGEAERLLRHLPVTAANYPVAWNMLIAEYDNPRLIINTHLQAILNAPPVKRGTKSELKALRGAIKDALSALRIKKRPVDEWSDLLVAIIQQKLDPETRRSWEQYLGKSTQFPTYDKIDEFLETRVIVEGAVENATTPLLSSPRAATATRPAALRPVRTHVSTTTTTQCKFCKSAHLLFACPNFKARSIEDRIAFVKEQRCCVNCLSSGHAVSKCRSQHRCFRCKRKHHTLLHSEDAEQQIETEPIRASASTCVGDPPSIVRCNRIIEGEGTVLLATAWVKLQTSDGRQEQVRALSDPGSDSSFVTESVVQTLRVSRRKIDVELAGLGDIPLGRARYCTDLIVTPCSKETPKIAVRALVTSRITRKVDNCLDGRVLQERFPNLQLADPTASGQLALDFLIGADLYSQILRDGVRWSSDGRLVAQATIFGWIVTGPFGNNDLSAQRATRVHHSTTLPMLASAIQRFWETEEPPAAPRLTAEEEACEQHFLQTHRRDPSGRYIVRLPFTNEPPLDIGYSRAKAAFLLDKLTARLQRSPELATSYNEFLKEYELMGHMRRVNPLERPRQTVYIPHHAVLRESSATTKLRVVFNASSPTSNGKALNDFLRVGPKLQVELPLIILRWRQYPFVYSADIAQMFRQILVDERDVDFQRILWNPPPTQTHQAYQLRTVTYGTACAPYLALRVLRQLAHDEGDRFPLARPVLERDFYVDDVLFGAFSQADAKATRDQLIQLLQTGGFHLRKWAANRPVLISDLPSTERTESADFPIDEENPMKILGISWASRTDDFMFRVFLPTQTPATKRSVLSTIARLFDPLGWIAPVVVYAKIILQELWLLKTEWDEPLVGELATRWETYLQTLPALNTVRLPRWTRQFDRMTACELHGFSDASSRAFGAVVYLRVTAPRREPAISLLLSKTRVAPLKTLSIPRLELNATALLVKLMASVIDALQLSEAPIYCWTDSSVVLAWLQKPPRTWQTFVANRVSYIQSRLPQAVWRHVQSQDNPADCTSRGLLASDLIQYPLWWNGPAWLRLNSCDWPSSEGYASPQPEAETRIVAHVRRVSEDEWELPFRISSWPRLLRVTAYCLRFINRLLPSARRVVPPSTVALSGTELRMAECTLVRYVQRRHFASDIEACRSQSQAKKSPLQRLHPFIDEDQLLRVGGRLRHSSLAYSEKHPILLPPHRISQLLAEDAHRRTLHSGPQLTLRTLRQRYWILGARNLVRRVNYKCIPCTRKRASVPHQLMSDLPAARVTPQRPFAHCGIDYAGPAQVLPIVGRGQRARKAYVAVFICLSTRAIHLELVSDNTTDAFLSAFRRFAARRGLPSDVYSDNGTNFHGAHNVLTRDFRCVMQDTALQSTLATDGIQWHFIPPAAPHFGGLWEAGVKSMKYHLSRVLGARTLSIEEFQTLLTQIEACLNSRPIGPNTLDPDDAAPLTPGHFLIGAPLVTVPEPSVLMINENRLHRWQLVRRALEEFWQSWSHDYLHTLQQRTKWTNNVPDFKEGELVLIRHPSLPPAKWALGRIIAVHPGSDKRVRVVSVRTASTIVKRPISQIVRLPITLENRS